MEFFLWRCHSKIEPHLRAIEWIFVLLIFSLAHRNVTLDGILLPDWKSNAGIQPVIHYSIISFNRNIQNQAFLISQEHWCITVLKFHWNETPHFTPYYTTHTHHTIITWIFAHLCHFVYRLIHSRRFFSFISKQHEDRRFKYHSTNRQCN